MKLALRKCALRSFNDIETQHNGIAMGSPLGPLFANFYMAHIENKVLQNSGVRASDGMCGMSMTYLST